MTNVAPAYGNGREALIAAACPGVAPTGLADAVRAPRIHHQWVPDQVIIERGMPNAIVQALEGRGHKPALRPLLTSANSIMIAPNGMRFGAADSRTRGALAAGY